MEAFSCLRTNFLHNGDSDFNIKEGTQAEGILFSGQ